MKRSAAPQKGCNSLLLNLTATKFTPKNKTITKKAAKVKLSDFLCILDYKEHTKFCAITKGLLHCLQKYSIQTLRVQEMS